MRHRSSHSTDCVPGRIETGWPAACAQCRNPAEASSAGLLVPRGPRIPRRDLRRLGAAGNKRHPVADRCASQIGVQRCQGQALPLRQPVGVRARRRTAFSSGDRSTRTRSSERFSRNEAVSDSVIRRRRSFTIRIFRTSNHHREGTTPSSARIRSKANPASGWSSSSNAQHAVIDASRTNAIRTFFPHRGPTVGARRRSCRCADEAPGWRRGLCQPPAAAARPLARSVRFGARDA